MAYRSSSSTSGAASTSVNGTAPAGVAAGDRLIAIVTQDASAPTITPPSGWSSIGKETFAPGGPDGHCLEIFEKKVATGSDSYAWTSNQTQPYIVQVVALTGRHTTTAATVQSTKVTTALTTPISMSLTGVTAATGDDVVLMFGLDRTSGTASWSFSQATSYTEVQDVSYSWMSNGTQYRANVSSGATGSLAITATRDSGADTAGYGGFVIAVPAAPASSDVLGWFDETAAAQEWFTIDARAEGWFDITLPRAIVASTPTGTVNVTTANATSAASGFPVTTGTLAQTTGNSTSAASGSPINKGTLAITTANSTSAASGSPIDKGTLAVTLANATSAASGSPIAKGTLAVSLSDTTASASGSPISSGTLAVTLEDSTAVASGTAGTSGAVGTADITLEDSTSEASGTVIEPTVVSSPFQRYLWEEEPVRKPREKHEKKRIAKKKAKKKEESVIIELNNAINKLDIYGKTATKLVAKKKTVDLDKIQSIIQQDVELQVLQAKLKRRKLLSTLLLLAA